MKGITLTFNDEYMTNFVAQSALSMLFSHSQRHPSAKLSKVAY